jgi:hypothetical protein
VVISFVVRLTTTVWLQIKMQSDTAQGKDKGKGTSKDWNADQDKVHDVWGMKMYYSLARLEREVWAVLVTAKRGKSQHSERGILCFYHRPFLRFDSGLPN